MSQGPRGEIVIDSYIVFCLAVCLSVRIKEEHFFVGDMTWQCGQMGRLVPGEPGKLYSISRPGRVYGTYIRW